MQRGAQGPGEVAIVTNTTRVAATALCPLGLDRNPFSPMRCIGHFSRETTEILSNLFSCTQVAATMSYFGGMDQEKEQKLAWKGASVDPRVQAMRDKLEKERLAEDARERERLKVENQKFKMMVADEVTKEDDDLMDEEAGRMIAVLHKTSDDFYKNEKKALNRANSENKKALKSVKSKIHSYNVRPRSSVRQWRAVAAACSMHARTLSLTHVFVVVPSGQMDQEDRSAARGGGED